MTTPRGTHEPRNWNLNFTYDWEKTRQLGVNDNDVYIYDYNYSDGADGGINGPNGDIYLYPHTQVDAKAATT